MEIRRALDALYRRAPVIFVVAALTMIVVAMAGILIPPVYTAKATVRILWDVGVADLSPREYVADRLITSYSEVLTTDQVLAEAIRRASPGTSSLSAQDLAEHVEVVVIPDSSLMSITVQNSNPVLARDLTDALSSLLVEYAQSSFLGIEDSAEQILHEQAAGYEQEIRADYKALATAEALDEGGPEASGLIRQIKVKEETYRRMLERAKLVQSYESLRTSSPKIISPATLPAEASNRLGQRELVLGLLIGIFGGVGLALFLDNMDTRIRGSHQLQELTELPILATVPAELLPVLDPAPSKKASKNPSIDEAYRLLSINLQALAEETSAQSILFTCATHGYEQGQVAANLVPLVAQPGTKTLIVDANLRHPAMHRIFNLSNQLGLASVLEEKFSLDQVVEDSNVPGAYVLPSGPTPPEPTQLLSSPAMADLMKKMSQQYDLVLLDAPPALSGPDAAALARTAEGVILLVDESLSTKEQVREALHQLRAARAQMVGLILVQKGRKRKHSK